jgi:hypothetical protein
MGCEGSTEWRDAEARNGIRFAGKGGDASVSGLGMENWGFCL